MYNKLRPLPLLQLQSPLLLPITMLSRLLPKPSHFRRLTLLSSKSHPHSPPNPHFSPLLKFFSNSSSSNNGKFDQSASTAWNISREINGKFDQFFAQDSGNLAGISPAGDDDQSWLRESEEKMSGEEEWATAEGYKPWSFVEKEKQDDVFGLKEEGVREVGDTGGESNTSVDDGAERDRRKETMRLEREEQELSATVKGIEGLPPLSEIEEMRYEKNTRKITRAEIERQKQVEVAKARVRQVDEKGRAYGTGRGKCSIARKLIQRPWAFGMSTVLRKEVVSQVQKETIRKAFINIFMRRYPLTEKGKTTIYNQNIFEPEQGK